MSKVSPRLIIVILVALLFGVALGLRVYFPYDRVFGSDWIKFTGIDAYYHMRLVDNLVHNFPHLGSFDPYLIYPGGAGVGNIRFFDWLLAGVTWIIGLGSPTEHTVDLVGVYFPAVLGALIVIPVYFIGRALFSRWAGVLSAGLLAVLPGEFLGRSILGFTDHHVGEVLLTTVTVMFFILAVKSASQTELSYSHLKHRNWARITRPLLYSLLSGLFLGAYIFTFLGALLFVFIIFLYLIIQFIIDHLKQKSTDYLTMVSVVFFLFTLILSLLISPGVLYTVSLVIALLTMPVLSGLSRLMIRWKLKPVYYPVTLFGLGVTGLVILYFVTPSLFGSMLAAFKVFVPAGAQLTTIEMQPILFPRGEFTLALVWGNFNTSFFLGLVSLGILAYLVIKQGEADKSLLVVWSLVILAATLGQRRFAYYFAVNVALLTGYLSWRGLKLTGLEEKGAEVVRAGQEAVRQRARLKKSGAITISRVNMALAVLIIFLIVYMPNIGPATTTAKLARYAPSDAWCSSLSWMRENTPDPFNNPDFYYASYQPPQRGEDYGYPETAYGVMAWWDYGYWITRMAHRMPNANPSQDPKALTTVASFFTAQDEKSASEIMREWNSSYVVIDHETATTKFWAIVTWAGKEQTEFFDVYLATQQDQRLAPVQLFHPGYYRSQAVRLYNFEGKAVTPESTVVISYQEREDEKGNRHKVIDSAEQFESYEEAEAYLSSQESDNYRIVSNNPLVSPVPLEELEHYRLVHSSNSTATLPDGQRMPGVKIFEYVGD